MVLMCAYNNRASPHAICPGSEGSQTFAPTGYIVDYHTLVTGSPAAYTRANVLGDFRRLLEELRPHDIYLPAYMERHNDHAASALFVTEAVLQIQRHAAYRPTLHEYMIYRPGLPQQSLDALAPVSGAGADMDSTPYAWDQREALPVPKEMYASLVASTNLKQLAFRAYLGGVEGYSRFIKADEVFWKTLSSLSY
jgi:LmbE family N-acetylglucosaminyl deacetylase